jgi:ABC-type oligopeptide transport system substrate-binding subunit
MGGSFGVNEWNQNKQFCKFGLVTKPENLLYCGPFIFNKFSKNYKFIMKKNPNYWDRNNVRIDDVEFLYVGQNCENNSFIQSILVDLFKDNQLTKLNVNIKNREKLIQAFGEETIFKQGTGTTTYYLNWNLNRQTYKVGKSKSAKTTDAEKENTRKAILNENFRKAVFSSIPKIEMNARSDDPEMAEDCIRNTYTTPEFVSIDKEVTNASTGVKHAANSQYFEMVNREMKALNKKNDDDFAYYESK